ncbi:putative glutaredoxin-1, grx1 [Corchorus olitorius]|uniref:Glutaredoxin-1, grx1 n=1 Tax=Corchorus olitorius TaxID=93759 RepID=A0A1R3J0E8_9ROSI|nr:putative glutaredoxin-1, grx1 [Corchorus olitorius]
MDSFLSSTEKSKEEIEMALSKVKQMVGVGCD